MIEVLMGVGIGLIVAELYHSYKRYRNTQEFLKMLNDPETIIQIIDLDEKKEDKEEDSAQ